MYKVTDRDGMYVRVAPSGALSFRLDYRAQWTTRDGLPGQIRARWNLAGASPGALPGCQTSDQRGPIASH
ncbi:hypothetical protein [Granulibacter bethesdensis]